MAIFKRKKGGTRVGNAVRSAFTVNPNSSAGSSSNRLTAGVYNAIGNTPNISAPKPQATGFIGPKLPAGTGIYNAINNTPSISAPAPRNISFSPQLPMNRTGGASGGKQFGPQLPAFQGPQQQIGPQLPVSSNESSISTGAMNGPFLPSSSNVSSNSQSGLPVSSQARSQASSPVAQSSLRSAVATPSAVAGPTAVGQGSLAVPVGGSMIGSTDFNYNRTPQQIAEEEARNNLANFNRQEGAQDVNQNRIFRDTLRQFQGEIDATNSVYAEQLRQAGIMGQSRLGSTRAENFNSGAVDSSFGNAAQERVASDNASVENGIMAQKLMAIAQIEGQARQLGNKFFQDRRSAKEAGLTNYLESIRGAGVAKEAISEDIAMSIFNSGVTDDEIEPAKLTRIAKDAGITVQQIKNSFRVIKQQAEATAMEEQRAIAKDEREMAKFEMDSRTTLSEGQALFDSQGNMIAQRGKTFAPARGGSGSGSGSGKGSSFSDFSPEIQLAAQSIFDGKSKLTEYPSAKRLQINQAFAGLYSAEGGDALAQAAFDSLTALETHKGFKGAIGAKSFSSLLGLKSKPFSGSKAAGFGRELDKLKANIKLVNVKYLKGAGALSDAEGRTLEDAGTSLDASLPEADFRNELARVKAALLKTSNISMGTSNRGGQLFDAQTGQTFDASNLTEEEYQEALADGLVQQ